MAAKGGKPPGHGPKLGAGKGMHSSAANGAVPAPFWASWGESFNQTTKNVGEGANKWWADVMNNRKNWKPPKFELPGVRVDIDVLNPMITSVKKGAMDIWIRLPPPVQQASPYVAVGTTTGLIAWKIQSSRLKREKKLTDKLQTRVETLLDERDKLQDHLKVLKGKVVVPKSASEMQMAAAVAEATTAAAAAASAAASAASKCSVVVRKPDGPQSKPAD